MPYNNVGYGGPAYGNSSPVVSYTVTFGSQFISGGEPNYYGYVRTSSPAWCCGGLEYADIENYAYDGLTEDYDENYAYIGGVNGYPGFVSGAGTYGYGETDTYDYNFDTERYTYSGYVEANISNVTVSGAVPEPSTWAMMALGFAGLGFAGFRQARRAAPAL